MGDGIGHICVTGVALGLLTGTSPTWTAVVVAVVGARADRADPHLRQGQRRRRAGAAVLRRHRRWLVLVRLAGNGAFALQAATSSARSPRSRPATWWVTVVLAGIVIVVGRRPDAAAVRGLARRGLRAGGRLPVRFYNMLVSVLAAVSVTRRDAHRGTAAGARADDHPGGDVAAVRPGRSGPRCSPRCSLGCWRVARRRACVSAFLRPRRPGADDRAGLAGRLRRHLAARDLLPPAAARLTVPFAPASLPVHAETDRGPPARARARLRPRRGRARRPRRLRPRRPPARRPRHRGGTAL